ncbi:MAG TPA: AsmA family protein [Steroidobacteraceae bacterium]|nr:AsmA family protein [Steroidobacteraceae bacterium]
MLSSFKSVDWSRFPRRHPVWTTIAAFLLALVILLILFDWNWLRRPVERMVSRSTGREFRIDGDLDVDFFPLEVHARKLYLGNAPWSAEPAMARVEQLDMHVRFWPLLAGRVTLPSLELDHPWLHLERSDEGIGNWLLGNWNQCRSDCAQRVHILQLLVSKGEVEFREPTLKTSIDLHVDSVKPAGKQTLAPLVLRGTGSYRDAPFELNGQVDSPLALQSHEAPYRLDLTARAGEIRARAYGALPEPLQTQDVEVNFELRGPDLAQLDRFAGIVLPTTPPYNLKGRLWRNGDRYAYRQFSGTVGDSDLAGDAEMDLRGKRPKLTAVLHSKVIDFDDLAGFVGGTPGTGEGETASEEQKKAASEKRATGKLLPSKPIQLERLRAMDADVRFKAARVNSPRLPLESMSAHLTLDDGRLAVDPLEFGAAGGRLVSKVHLDARKSPASFAMTTDIRQLELPKLMPRIKRLNDAIGTFAGIIELNGRGESAAEILGSSDGAMSVIMGQGRVSNLLLEIAGLDIAESLAFLIGKDQQVTVRCAYADFGIEDGLATARAVAFDTTDTALLVRGDISFANESLDLTLLPRPKDPSPLSIRTPLKIGGTFADPSLGVKGGPLMLRGGAVAALAAIAPPLALLALVEPGNGKDTDCGRSVGSPPQEKGEKPKPPPLKAPKQQQS